MKTLTFSGGGEGGTPIEPLVLFQQRYYVPDLATPSDYFFDVALSTPLANADAYISAKYGNGSGALVYTDVVANRSVVILRIFAYASAPPTLEEVYDFGGFVTTFTETITACGTTGCIEIDMGASGVLESITLAPPTAALNNLNLNIPTDLLTLSNLYKDVFGSGCSVTNPSGNIYRIINAYTCVGLGGSVLADLWTGDLGNGANSSITCP